MRFIYTPSNLSRDELYCYCAEKLCHKIGLFEHGTFYSKLIDSRIEIETNRLKMRTKYEKLYAYDPDGTGSQMSDNESNQEE
jgi:hypothetical protein